MPVTLPIEVYEAFEKGLGKEEAKIVVKSFETTIENVTANTWEKTKNELLDRLVSKEEFRGQKEEFKGLKDEFRELREEFRAFREEMRGQINETNRRIDETNKRIDSVMKIQLWIMGLIAIQAVAVIVKLLFS